MIIDTGLGGVAVTPETSPSLFPFDCVSRITGGGRGGGGGGGGDTRRRPRSAEIRGFSDGIKSVYGLVNILCPRHASRLPRGSPRNSDVGNEHRSCSPRTMNPFPNSCCSRVVFIRRLLGDIDCETEVDRCLISSIGERKWKVRRNSSSLFIYF